MEIAALICNDNLDYESALQTYSIFQFSRKNGNQIQIVDYNLLDKNVKSISLKAKNNLLYNFLDNNIILTAKRYATIEQLENNLPLADEYLVVNAKYKDLDIFPKSESVAYGIKDIDKDEINLIKDDYKDFSTLFEIKGTQVKKVVDPLFLLSKEEWIEFSEKSTLSEDIKDYVLVYGKTVTKDMLDYAKNLSEKYNCKIFIVADKIKSIIYKGKRLSKTSPSDLIRLISNSSNIVTSCDDGIKLSVLFEKNVHIFKSDADDLQIEMINDLNLLDRIVTAPDRVIMKESNSKEAIEKIENLKLDSIKFFE